MLISVAHKVGFFYLFKKWKKGEMLFVALWEFETVREPGRRWMSFPEDSWPILAGEGGWLVCILLPLCWTLWVNGIKHLFSLSFDSGGHTAHKSPATYSSSSRIVPQYSRVPAVKTDYSSSFFWSSLWFFKTDFYGLDDVRLISIYNRWMDGVIQQLRAKIEVKFADGIMFKAKVPKRKKNRFLIYLVERIM